jgi:hypothetical protein
MVQMDGLGKKQTLLSGNSKAGMGLLLMALSAPSLGHA